MIGAVAGYLALWLVYWGFKLATGKEGMGYRRLQAARRHRRLARLAEAADGDPAFLRGRRRGRHRPDRVRAPRPREADPLRPLPRRRRGDRALLGRRRSPRRWLPILG